MLTRSGVLVLVGAAAMVTSARLFGIAELYITGSIAFALPVLAVIWVRRPAPSLRAERSIRPRRVHLGGPSRVELTVSNTGKRRAPVLMLHDPVDGTTGARVAMAPLDPGHVRQAGYRLPTDRRGRIQIGPLRAEVSDPFGLARRRVPVTEAASLTVLPGVETLTGLPRGAGRDDPLAGPVGRSVGTGADDFTTLRPYVVGDDLRRVHWPSTARSGDLLVRQDDDRWQGHVTLLLDARRDRIDEKAFETAVSAMASLVLAVARAGDRIRLLVTDGTDSGLIDAQSDADTLLERLALVTRHDGGSVPLLPSDGRARTGTLVLATGRPATDDLATVANARRAFAAVMMVSVTDEAQHAPDVPAAHLPPGIDVITMTPDQPFAPAWHSALARVIAERR